MTQSRNSHLIWRLAFIVLIVLASVASDFGWQWLGGRDAVFTITTIDAKQKAFSVAEYRSAVWAWTDSIRRERQSGGTTAATFADLRPGVRVRVYGGGSSSPLGFVAHKIIIVAEK